MRRYLLIMALILSCGLVFGFFTFPLHAQSETKDKFEIRTTGSVLAGGMEFKNLTEYYLSDYFKKSGKRCGTGNRPIDWTWDLPGASTGDCTLSRTIIQGEYWPIRTYVIPVVFHIIHKTDGTGNIPDQRLHDQLQVLNEDYRALSGTLGSLGFDTKIQFKLEGITRTANNQWHLDYNEYQYKNALGWDQYRYLNVYVNSAGGYLGYSYLAQEAAGSVYDGVVVLYESVGGRNNGFFPYDEGRTLVHEVGHYLGLLHTFEGYGCYSGYQAGDLIADTHSENTEHYSCVQTTTCGTADDIHNYMNYTDDACMHEFTVEQANRLVCSLVNYRPALAASAASITVTSPNGGENWWIGATRNITWDSSGLANNIHIILQQNGANVALLAKNINPAQGSFAWTVGDCLKGTVTPGSGFRAVIREINSTIKDASNAPFEISSGTAPELTLTSPNGGENWQIGETRDITWNAAGLSNRIHIILQQNGANVALIAKGFNPGAGHYTWTVGDCLVGAVNPGSNCKILLREKNSTLRDKSDASFEISSVSVPSITVTSPNGGENWTLGSSHNITWSANALTGNVNITLWKDGSYVGNVADNIVPAAGYYSWTVGQYDGGTAAAGTGYTVRIEENGSAVSDISDASFEISTSTLPAWTFMVYLDGDNNLEDAGIDDFLEMSSVGSTNDVNIVVQFDRIGGYASSYDNWTGTKRYYVTPGMTPTAANALMDIGEANMGDPATLIAFVNWAKANYPADNYALILWNHGDGWRKTGEKPVKGVCWDDTNGGDCLYTAEIGSAMNTCGGAQLIGFDACLMGMIEIAYEIKDYGQVMVGSEETEPWDGWPYDTIMSDLTAQPTWTAAQLGSAIVDRYYASYSSGETQAALDLSNLAVLSGVVNTFAQTTINNWNTNQAAVKNAAAAVMAEINNTVINEKHGSGWPGSHGLAIYFPVNLGSFDSDYNGTIIGFAKDTQWDEFLKAYYNSMTGSWIATGRNGSQDFDIPEHIDLYHFCQLLQ